MERDGVGVRRKVGERRRRPVEAGVRRAARLAAQVAAFADAHFKVTKTIKGDRTISGVEHLSQKAMEHELAEMSVGADVDAEALREARRLRARATG